MKNRLALTNRFKLVEIKWFHRLIGISSVFRRLCGFFSFNPMKSNRVFKFCGNRFMKRFSVGLKSVSIRFGSNHVFSMRLQSVLIDFKSVDTFSIGTLGFCCQRLHQSIFGWISFKKKSNYFLGKIFYFWPKNHHESKTKSCTS